MKVEYTKSGDIKPVREVEAVERKDYFLTADEARELSIMKCSLMELILPNIHDAIRNGRFYCDTEIKYLCDEEMQDIRKIVDFLQSKKYSVYVFDEKMPLWKTKHIEIYW